MWDQFANNPFHCMVPYPSLEYASGSTCGSTKLSACICAIVSPFLLHEFLIVVGSSLAH